MDRQATFTNTSKRRSSMVIALWLQSVTVVDRQATFTGTSTKISSMEMALWLQSVFLDRQATYTDTSTKISSMEIALCLQYVTVVDKSLSQVLHGDGSVAAVCDCRGPTSNFHRYFHQDRYHGDGSVSAGCM